jgi:7-cyano-7-deazaguanine reductase
MSVQNSPLKKTTHYETEYNPSLLFPIARKETRKSLELSDPLPFHGIDIWNGYELSWLDPKGKPQLATAEFQFAVDSEFILESKSFKLYLCSYHQTHFNSIEDVQKRMQDDLEKASKGSVRVTMHPKEHSVIHLPQQGFCIDDLPVTTNTYTFNPDFLSSDSATVVDEQLFTNMFMSNCPVTNQSDWASIFIQYKGPKIDREGLLKYIISFRRTNGFAEDSVERIFRDINDRCHPQELSVNGRFTRRGGLDINPFRTNGSESPENFRLLRQ